jgi:eukaryotic-like serine/threonine-protein kinase
VVSEHEALERVARVVAPDGAEVHHLCAAGAGTFSVATDVDVPLENGTYALKVAPEAQPGPGRMSRDFEALRRIDHPHLVKYRASGVERLGGADYRWLAMDFVEGSTLQQLLGDGVTFALPTAVRLLQELLSGAAALWDVGTTHGALSADNVMIGRSGDAVIVDLGLAQNVVSPHQGSTVARQQNSANQPCDDWRADQLALGLLGYRMVVGTDLAARHGDRGAELRVLMQAAPRMSSDGSPAVHRELARILARMLASRPQDRFAEPATLQAELGRVAEALGAA